MCIYVNYDLTNGRKYFPQSSTQDFKLLGEKITPPPKNILKQNKWWENPPTIKSYRSL